MKDHVNGNAKNTARPAKAKVAREHPSFASERAEGEGMIAAAPDERDPHEHGERQALDGTEDVEPRRAATAPPRGGST